MTLNLLALFAGFIIPLIPVYAADVFDVGGGGFGVMMAAFGVGGTLGTLVLVLGGDSSRKGLLMVVSGGVFGACMILFAFSREYYLSLFFLGLMGGFGMAYVITINVLVQTHTPDEMRGRVMGIRMLAVYGLPMGLVIGGWLIEQYGVPATITGYAIVGLIALMFAVLKWPKLVTGFSAEERG